MLNGPCDPGPFRPGPDPGAAGLGAFAASALKTKGWPIISFQVVTCLSDKTSITALRTPSCTVVTASALDPGAPLCALATSPVPRITMPLILDFCSSESWSFRCTASSVKAVIPACCNRICRNRLTWSGRIVFPSVESTSSISPCIRAARAFGFSASPCRCRSCIFGAKDFFTCCMASRMFFSCGPASSSSAWTLWSRRRVTILPSGPTWYDCDMEGEEIMPGLDSDLVYPSGERRTQGYTKAHPWTGKCQKCRGHA